MRINELFRFQDLHVCVHLCVVMKWKYGNLYAFSLSRIYMYRAYVN